MSPFFTRQGDDGSTGLLGEGRVKKSDPRFETLGALDELTATLGLARSLCGDPLGSEIKALQTTLYQAMAEVAATPDTIEQFRRIDLEVISELESKIEIITQKVIVPKGFILPGDSTIGAVFSMARAVARRVERRLVELSERETTISKELKIYFNRLSSYLFVLELYAVQKMEGKNLTLAKKPNV